MPRWVAFQAALQAPVCNYKPCGARARAGLRLVRNHPGPGLGGRLSGVMALGCGEQS